MRACVSLLLTLGMLVLSGSVAHAQEELKGSVTKVEEIRANQLEVTLIGQPVAKKEEAARKINELKIFNNRLYIGYGCWTRNTGPTEIIYYDLTAKEFRTEGLVDEEAIVKYRVLNDRLVIPGIDATEYWNAGNCYVRDGGGWQKHRSLLEAAHVYDIVSFENRWYAGTHSIFGFPSGGMSGTPGVGMIVSSANQGVSWELEYAAPVDVNTDSFIRSIIEYKGKLYAFTTFQTGPNTTSYIKKYGKSRGPVYDALGSLDTIVYEDGLWNYRNLIQDPNVFEIVPFVVGDSLCLSVVCGEGDPADWGLISPVFYEFDGESTQKLAFHCSSLVDVVTRPDVTFLLIRLDKKSYVAETQDLHQWTYYSLPVGQKDWLSLECEGQSFYLGTSEGSVYRAERQSSGAE